MFWDNDLLVGAKDATFKSIGQYYIGSPAIYHGGKPYAVAFLIRESGLLSADYSYHISYDQRPAL